MMLVRESYHVNRPPAGAEELAEHLGRAPVQLSWQFRACASLRRCRAEGVGYRGGRLVAAAALHGPLPMLGLLLLIMAPAMRRSRQSRTAGAILLAADPAFTA